MKPASLYDYYDAETLRMKPSYADLYKRMTKEFKDLGFDYPAWG